jgi:hypothetical protein
MATLVVWKAIKFTLLSFFFKNKKKPHPKPYAIAGLSVRLLVFMVSSLAAKEEALRYFKRVLACT